MGSYGPSAKAYYANKRKLSRSSTSGSRIVCLAKFAGVCRECGGPVRKGDAIVWFSSSKAVEHESCDTRRRQEARS